MCPGFGRSTRRIPIKRIRKITDLRIGDFVSVEWMDHAKYEGGWGRVSEKPPPILVSCGRLADIPGPWCTLAVHDEVTGTGENSEWFTAVTPAIRQIVVYRAVAVWNSPLSDIVQTSPTSFPPTQVPKPRRSSKSLSVRSTSVLAASASHPRKRLSARCPASLYGCSRESSPLAPYEGRDHTSQSGRPHKVRSSGSQRKPQNRTEYRS